MPRPGRRPGGTEGANAPKPPLDLPCTRAYCQPGHGEPYRRSATSRVCLGAPAAGFGEHQEYPDLAVKVAVLLQRVASNHALPDGNKRTALLCAILFANLNGLDWEPPKADDPDGAETAEVVEAAAGGNVPLAALAAWVGDRLWEVPSSATPELPARVIYPAEYVGPLS